MQRMMMKSKIHRATVTGLELDYPGSIAIDEDLLEAADILPGEQVQVVNVNNGERFVTYAIRGKRGKGGIVLKGAAARLAAKGDLVIIITYAGMEDAEAKSFRPKVALVDAANRLIKNN
jgi:aspartate 1-decarboxylase